MPEPVTAQPGDAAMEAYRDASYADAKGFGSIEAEQAAAAIIRAYGDARVAEERARTLAEVERHLSAVQYDPAPYTAMKYRLAELANKT